MSDSKEDGFDMVWLDEADNIDGIDSVEESIEKLKAQGKMVIYSSERKKNLFWEWIDEKGQEIDE
jgi:hypothetical protein